MSKTFKNASGWGHELYIWDGIGSTTLHLMIRDVGATAGKAGIYLNSSDAPALALAILEAAGVVHHDPEDTPYEKSERTENMGALNMSAFYLAKHVNDAEKAEFLTKEQPELEAEALELFRASQCIRTDGMYVSVPSFAELSDPSKTKWLAVARKAREINKEEVND